jgi:outer membrane protein OmpA-like peptidoglycan-associated protein
MRLLIIGLFGAMLIAGAKAQPYGGYPSTATYHPSYTTTAVTVVLPPPEPETSSLIVMPSRTTYLIAFKDSVVGLADAYWVSGATLHYVTPDHQMKTAPLATIDIKISEQLNWERHIVFSLPSQPGEAELRRLLDRLNAILETRSTSRGLIVGISDLLFDFNQATLTPMAREKLAGIARILVEYGSPRLRLQGYTDNIGSAEVNLELSRRRADAVRAYLVSQGVPAATVTASGFGSASPVATNATATGRQQNRRVDMLISGAITGVAITSGPPD